MTATSRTPRFATTIRFGSDCVSLQDEGGRPVLVLLDPEDKTREVGRYYLTPEAAQKLAEQAAPTDPTEEVGP